MSHCQSVQIEGLTYKPSDMATSWQRAARQRAVWRASLETGRQDDSTTTQRAIYQISHHNKYSFQKYTNNFEFVEQLLFKV
jgi:hypothetical protein